MSDSRILNTLNKSNPVASSNSGSTTSSTNQSQNFSSLMQKNTNTQESKMMSPFDLAQNGAKMNPVVPSQNTVLAQIQLAQNTMARIQEQASYPNLKLKSSQKNIIKSKLSSASTSFKSAHTKFDKSLLEQDGDSSRNPSKGLSLTSTEDSSAQEKGPMSSLFDYVTAGLNEMDAVKQLVSDIGNKRGNLNPGDFLLIQIKLAKAQQELEFTSGLLSKVVEDFKMIMNIQL